MFMAFFLRNARISEGCGCHIRDCHNGAFLSSVLFRRPWNGCVCAIHSRGRAAAPYPDIVHGPDFPMNLSSLTWGMIMLRLDTRIRHPGCSSRPLIKVRLWRLALDTSQPSISTVSNTATGAISPLRLSATQWSGRPFHRCHPQI